MYDWLADVDKNGNVPFPWNQGQKKGTTFFTVSAGGVEVKFQVTYA